MSDTSRSAEKPTSEWVTGDEPMTGPQESYLQTLAREAGEDVPAGLTKAQASEMIERLQAATGRGTDSAAGATDGSGGEHLGEKAEREGIVDQQATLLDQIEDSATTPAAQSGSATPT